MHEFVIGLSKASGAPSAIWWSRVIRDLCHICQRDIYLMTSLMFLYSWYIDSVFFIRVFIKYSLIYCLYSFLSYIHRFLRFVDYMLSSDIHRLIIHSHSHQIFIGSFKFQFIDVIYKKLYYYLITKLLFSLPLSYFF